MRRLAGAAVLLVLGVAVLYVRGQAAEPAPPASGASAAPGVPGTASPPPSDPGAPSPPPPGATLPGAFPPGAVPGPEPFFGSKLDWFLGQPGRVIIREVWDIGDVEGRPWDANPADAAGRVRVHAVFAHEDGKPEQKVKGLMLVLSAPGEERTFYFDAEQVPELLGALGSVKAAADKVREPPAGARRRAVYVINGLEISMDASRTGGYLGQFGPDEITLRMNPDNFIQLKQLLDKAQDTLIRAGR
jgi:hypothetical protein